jgi:predicted RNase H-like HicB family nuclease
LVLRRARRIGRAGGSKDVIRYAVVIEKAARNYSAYVPDLPGCIATGETLPEIEREIREAIAFYIAGLREDGLPVPKPTTITEYVDAAS